MSEHTHKYKKVKLGEDYIVYKCMISGCTHYIRKELVIGLHSICWACGNIFTMDSYSSQKLKPKCAECRTRKVAA